MSDDNEIADENLGIIDSIMELWNRAAPDPNLTTSQKMDRIDPEMAKWYRLDKKNAENVARVAAAFDEKKRRDQEADKEREAMKEGVHRGVMQIIKAIFGK